MRVLIEKIEIRLENDESSIARSKKGNFTDFELNKQGDDSTIFVDDSR